MASSSSSHLLGQIKYDVFVSFRGEDIRDNFLSHLTKQLRQKDIDVYVDERLEKGDEIWAALVEAIEASKISLIIFSKQYASSKWCLKELLKIIECNQLNGQIVIPVFYHVDPSDVRHQSQTYRDAFAKHEQNFNANNNMHKFIQCWTSVFNIIAANLFGYSYPSPNFDHNNSMEKLMQSWRSALNKAANFSGYHYGSPNFENESKLIDAIVKDILEKLDDICPIDESKRLVGFERNLACVESLLEIESQEVIIVGIWGMGGIGKTTLAQAVCDKFSSQFKGCYLLENIREEARKINGLNHLLQKIFTRLLDEENGEMIDRMKMSAKQRRLNRKKVLLVLDDVETSEQLKYLVEQLHLGSGSKVIITSRDKHVLVSGRVHKIHKIEELNSEDSLELFSLNAFNQSHPKMGYEELSEIAVFYAKGIPMALKVLGLHLYGENEETWESELLKLQKYPNLQIQNVFKVSYDGLDDAQKNIFLDIAFFFRGGNKDNVRMVLDACDFYATSGIVRLGEKALITISSDNKIQMHDLLQEIGEQIVRQESIKHPERRSRLKDIEEVYEVLQNNMGTDAIEGIILDVSQVKNVHLSADTFKRMPNLRILKMYSESWCKRSNVNVSSGLESFPSKLRYFRWDEYPLECFPPMFCTEKLVEFHMERSCIERLWNGEQDLVNLKILNLIGCKKLMELCDFSTACNLEKVVLSDCDNLCSVHPSFFSLNTLSSLDLMWCQGGTRFPLNNLHSLTSLKSLSLVNCNQVNKRELQNLFDTLHGLEGLKFHDCKHLFEIPDNISALSSSLKSLHLDGSSLEILPSSIKHLSKLQNLSLNNCAKLRTLPALPAFIKRLHAQQCYSLETINPFITCPLEDSNNWDNLDFSFKECINLDEQSLGNLMGFTHLSIMQSMGKNFSNVDACYPGSSVPEWFVYKMTTMDLFVIELAHDQSCGQFLGFILCFVIPHRYAANQSFQISCLLGFEDGSAIRSNKVFYFEKLNIDNVFLWFCPSKEKLNGMEEGEKYVYDDESIDCMFICQISDEYVGGIPCGVCPIYASKSH